MKKTPDYDNNTGNLVTRIQMQNYTKLSFVICLFCTKRTLDLEICRWKNVSSIKDDKLKDVHFAGRGNKMCHKGGGQRGKERVKQMMT